MSSGYSSFLPRRTALNCHPVRRRPALVGAGRRPGRHLQTHREAGTDAGGPGGGLLCELHADAELHAGAEPAPADDHRPGDADRRTDRVHPARTDRRGVRRHRHRAQPAPRRQHHRPRLGRQDDGHLRAAFDFAPDPLRADVRTQLATLEEIDSVLAGHGNRILNFNDFKASGLSIAARCMPYTTR
jgi:hypothetical protein